MFRYFAVIWDARDQRESEVARMIVGRRLSGSRHWHTGLATDGLAILHTDERRGAADVYVLDGGCGIVVGALFAKNRCHDCGESGRCTSLLDATETRRIIQSEGRSLVTDYWGRYVAFLRDSPRDRKWILRDPSGGLPCLRTALQGVEVYGSCMDGCLDVLPLSFSINWRYLAARVVDSQIRSVETGLSEVTEVRPAECVAVEPSGTSRTFYWNPCHVARVDVIADPGEAAEALRATTRSCVNAWASGHDRILQQLSGGLDSTIVACCLKEASNRPNVVCVNDFSSGADTDERGFARVAAQRAGFRLVERRRDAEVRIEDTLKCARSAVPTYRLNWIRCTPTDSELVADLGATALFTGRGGDELFYTSRREWPAADYLFDHGPRPRLLKIALDVACMDPTSRCTSVWTILRFATRYGFFLGRRDPFRRVGAYRNRKLVHPDVVDRMRCEKTWLHPWFTSDRGIAPGKSMHAYRLSFPQPFYEATEAEDVDIVHPLASQPLVELALRIPTYVLMSDGQERVIARRAFAQDIPSEIATRFVKGGIADHAIDVLRVNIQFVREFLLDGALVTQGLLDRRALLEVLGGRQNDLVTGTREIFDHLQTEAWARAWMTS